MKVQTQHTKVDSASGPVPRCSYLYLLNDFPNIISATRSLLWHVPLFSKLITGVCPNKVHSSSESCSSNHIVVPMCNHFMLKNRVKAGGIIDWSIWEISKTADAIFPQDWQLVDALVPTAHILNHFTATYQLQHTEVLTSWHHTITGLNWPHFW